ncbi:MAG: Crp/Fnr family transcriptional regulator [Chloroflexota bacterium]|nr:Crp/Fnr family transcriptional regulator [Chloroflexota bacterium]MDE2962266.1 Crp/Fnr family transcriptional regulator [Chloroflexota bacterium]
MALILTFGDWRHKPEHLHHLLEAGYLLGTSAQIADALRPDRGLNPRGLVAMVHDEADVTAAASVCDALGLPWLAWDCCGGMWLTARRLGAQAVLPSETSPPELEEAVAVFLPEREAPDGGSAPAFRSYRAGETILVDAESVAEVRSGIVAMRTSHSGGSDFMMGLFGPGDCISGHHVDAGHVGLVAHSDAQVAVRPWRDVATTWEYAERSRRLQTYLARWYSVQSTVSVEQRMVGILTLLAERFGRPAGAGWEVIDVRLTHQHLADAVCASRPTVSRALHELLQARMIRFQGAGDHRRVDLRRCPAGDTGMR